MEKSCRGDSKYLVLAFNPNRDGTLTVQSQVLQLGRFLDSLWQSYKSWARENESLLIVLDEVLGRLVFVPVYPDVVGYNFRHVFFVLSEVHRTLLQVAVDPDTLELNGFSTSLAIPATNISRAIRAGLIVLKAMGPVLQEVEPRKGNESRGVPSMVILQRFRFALRCALMANYWYRTMWGRRVLPGILLEGGLFLGRQQTVHFRDVCRWKESTPARYRGCRMGLHVPPLADSGLVIKKALLLLAEVINIMRPLLLAESEYTALPQSKKWRTWKTAVFLDLLSLSSLHFCGLDSVGRQEWERRRWRLALYVLRSPIWETHTLQAFNRFSRFPGWRILGSYIEYWRLCRNDE